MLSASGEGGEYKLRNECDLFTKPVHVRMKCKVFRHKKPVQRKKFDEINHLFSSPYRRVQTYLFILFLDIPRAISVNADYKTSEEKCRSGEKVNVKAQIRRDNHDQNCQKLFQQLFAWLRGQFFPDMSLDVIHHKPPLVGYPIVNTMRLP